MATKNLITWTVLAGCVGILQWHGIQFWSAHVDSTTGWAWSLTLEGTGLWLWWTGRRALGVCASALLLIGPLYVVSGPLVADLGRAEHADSARTRLIPAAEAKVASIEREIQAFLSNSGKRAGWLAPIEAAQSRLDAARADLGRLYTERPEAGGLGWRTRAVIALQAIALVLFQISAIFSICELAKFRPVMKPILPRVDARYSYASVAAGAGKREKARARAFGIGLTPGVNKIMKPRELMNAKLTLEDDLHRLIQARVAQFQEATGFCPSQIAVGMIERTPIGGLPDYIVGPVVVEVRL